MMQLVLWIIISVIWKLFLVQAARHTSVKQLYTSLRHSSENIVAQERVVHKKKGWTKR